MEVFGLPALELIYIFTGIILIVVSVLSFMDTTNSKRFGTGLFWLIYGISFVFGKYIPDEINGWMVIALAVIVATKQLGKGSYNESTMEMKQSESERIGNAIFVPALLVGIVTFIIGIFTKLGALVGLGIAAIAALLFAFGLTRVSIYQGFNEGRRLIDAIGWTAILSQLLAALGYVFGLAGVGQVIATGISSVIPVENIFAVVATYCIGMAIFTIVMGNAFAAFAMMTTGIGIPMLIQMHGANPAYIGPIAMLAGYCGTLVTPMAANFNIVPTALLEMKDQYGVIKAQWPVAMALLVVNILIMYYLVIF